MKKFVKTLVLTFTTMLALSACQTNTQKSDPDKEGKLVFRTGDIVQKSFGGLGVEWGAYEDTDKLIEGGWDLILNHMDHLGAQRIRLMVSYDWFVANFDDKDDDDKTNDTWSYNFTNKYAKNMLDILEYCEIKKIDVAFGAWNVIADLNGPDVWGMMDEVTKDIRWAKVNADVFDYLVNKKGFTCIKWLVNTNEPNYAGQEGQSKNFNNTYEIWEQGVKNVRKALDDVGLKHIGIIGGDTTGFAGSQEYLINISKNIKDKVGDYGAHLYVSKLDVGLGTLQAKIEELYAEIKKNDKRLGNTIQADIWEAGLIDGKTALDCQNLITTPDYAVRMTDFTVQCLSAGINGITYWDFDDAMHFMYTATTMTPKEWGMFSSLAGANSGKQELRPWYHTSSLLCHMFRKTDKVFTLNVKDVNTFRTIASVSQDGSRGGIVAVNAGAKDLTQTFRIDEKVSGDKVYVYVFNANSYRLGEDGYIIPNYVVDGSLNDEMTITVPRSSAIFLSNVRL